MTQNDVKVNLTRIGIILGVIVALWALVTAATQALDNRYIRLPEMQRVESKLDRVLDLVCEGKEAARACQP